MTASPDELPRSIAIAGAWGYIGRKFLDVALARGLTTFAYDPGPFPPDVDAGLVTRVEDEAAFDRLPAEVFHLAVHPEHRRLAPLLARDDAPLILVEKPMAEPGHPEACRDIIDAVAASRAIVLYDFPELYDPITARIIDHLAGFREVCLAEILVRRSKDREDPANPRNFKRMVPIQYQESVHCLAFALHVVSAVAGGLDAGLQGGLQIEGESTLYNPPNPDAYPSPVDGRCRFGASVGALRIEGLTDFKAGAPWAKRRTIRGEGDGRPFRIEASYLEGKKGLRIDGVDQPVDPAASSYEAVLATATRWTRQFDRDQLMGGLFPNPRFARMTYQLSSALWRSCRDGKVMSFASAERIESWDSGFATAPIPD